MLRSCGAEADGKTRAALASWRWHRGNEAGGGTEGRRGRSSAASATAAGARPRRRAGCAPPRPARLFPASLYPALPERAAVRPQPSGSPGASLGTRCSQGAAPTPPPLRPRPARPRGRERPHGRCRVLAGRLRGWRSSGRRGDRGRQGEKEGRGGGGRPGGAPPPARGGLPGRAYTDALAAAPRRRCGPPENVALKV